MQIFVPYDKLQIYPFPREEEEKTKKKTFYLFYNVPFKQPSVPHPSPFFSLSVSHSLTLPCVHTHTHISRKHEEVGPTSFIEAPSLNYLHNKDEIRLKTDGFNLRGKTGRKNLRFLSN
jgi:hypothetical protein